MTVPAFVKDGRPHGSWKGLGAAVDQRIRVLLARGHRPERAAEMVGVATGYAVQLARELADAEKADEPPRPEAPKPAAESPHAQSRVQCVVAGDEIGARDCVARQCADHCFCPKASFAINAVAPHALPGTRLENELVQCRAFARSVLSSAERYYGPARDARDGKKVEAHLVSPVPLPAPPKREERQPLITARPERSYALERVTRAEPIRKEEENPMSERTCPLEGRKLRADNTKGWCSEHISPNADGRWRLNAKAYAAAQAKGINVPEEHRPMPNGADKAKPPAAPAKPAAPRIVKPREPKAPPSAPAIPDDIVGMLQRQRDHYQAQVARIDRALAALSE